MTQIVVLKKQNNVFSIDN